MKDYDMTISKKVEEYKYYKMVPNLKEHIKKEKKMDLGFINGKMAVNIKENERMI